jgi:LysR family transcriptional regulator, hypochlorite-specific transcription factor HypT
MDTSVLADLQALARTLNFSRAAELRNITQPAFGRRIRALEDWCGSALVDRRTHRLKLTPAGEIMLEAAADVTRRLDRVQHELEQSRAATARLTFAATHALSFIFFPAWVQTLGAVASTMPIRLLSDNMNECERIMLSGGAQFLLCHHHPDSLINLPASDFQHVELARDRLIPVSARDREGQPLHRLPGSARAPVPCIAFEPTSGMGRILQSKLFDEVRDLHLTPVFTSHLATVLKALAADGKGVAWVPESLVTDELRPEGRLTMAGPEAWAVEVLIALFRPRARMAEMAERFWDLAR